MNRSLLTASWLAVGRTSLLTPGVAAVLLALITIPWLHFERLPDVMHGLAILLACAWAGTTDDPAGEVAAASPYPARVRTGARLLIGLVLVAPLYTAAAVSVELRFEQAPTTAWVVEAAGYGLVAIAIGASLRARLDMHAPAYAASIGLLGFAFVTFMLPTSWAMIDPQTWGPPWTAALIRWGAVAVLTAAVLCDALRDRGASKSTHATPE